MDKKFCPYCGKPLKDSCGCEESLRDERFPVGYCEIEYSDFDNAEAIDGARFDDANFLRHFER